LQVRGGDDLVRLGVTNGDHVVVSDFWSVQNVAGKVKVYWQWNEFEQWHQILRWH